MSVRGFPWMDRLYRYVKSRRWASSFGASSLSVFETLWSHFIGFVKRGQPPPRAPDGATALSVWATSESVVAFKVPFEEHVSENSSPNSIYAADPAMFQQGWTQRIEAGFVASIAGGYVWRDGAVLLPDGTLLEESLLVPPRHPLVRGARLPRATRWEGSLGVLSSTYGRGFYHWVFDSLARLAIMEAADVRPNAFIVNYTHLPFQVEWLQALGLDLNSVHSSIELPFVRPDQVIVTQIPGRDGVIPEYAVEYLRRKLRGGGDRSKKGPRRVFVSRRQAARRRVANEAEIEKVLSNYGFVSIALETIPLKERSELLSDAEIFLCPDGAGLTNMLFCDERVKVIEMFTHRANEPFGWSLSNRLGLPYHYVLGDPDRPGHVRPDDIEQTIELALSKID